MRNDNKLTYSDIGAYLYKLRKELKLSRGEIARKAKVSTRTIYNVENGCHAPCMREMEKTIYICLIDTDYQQENQCLRQNLSCQCS